MWTKPDQKIRSLAAPLTCRTRRAMQTVTHMLAITTLTSFVSLPAFEKVQLETCKTLSTL